MGYRMLVGGAAALAICSTSLAGMTVTAENLPADGYNLGGSVGVSDTQFAQLFLAEETGTLSGVTLRIARNADVIGDMLVDVYTIDSNGLPDSLLGTGAASPDEVAPQATVFHRFEIDTASVLRSGTQYAIVMRAQFAHAPGEPTWGLAGFNSDVYDGGTTLQSGNGGGSFFEIANRDWGFSVTVPAPGTVALAGVAGLAGLRRRR